MDYERRAFAEFRVADGRRLVGHAAVFGREANIGPFRESIRSGAFAASLAKRGDVLALLDHDMTKVLARTGNASLALQEDARGLAFSMSLPDTSAGRDVRSMAESGLLGGMSFAFRATDEAWPAADRRELRSVDLIEISVVQSFPAYSGTDIALRSRPVSLQNRDLTLRRMRLALI